MDAGRITVHVAADLFGAKENIAVQFAPPLPGVDEIMRVIEGVYQVEMESAKPEGIGAIPRFEIQYMQLFDPAIGWQDITNPAQLADGLQIFAFQPRSDIHSDNQAMIPVAKQPMLAFPYGAGPPRDGGVAVSLRVASPRRVASASAASTAYNPPAFQILMDTFNKFDEAGRGAADVAHIHTCLTDAGVVIRPNAVAAFFNLKPTGKKGRDRRSVSLEQWLAFCETHPCVARGICDTIRGAENAGDAPGHTAPLPLQTVLALFAQVEGDEKGRAELERVRIEFSSLGVDMSAGAVASLFGLPPPDAGARDTRTITVEQWAGFARSHPHIVRGIMTQVGRGRSPPHPDSPQAQQQQQAYTSPPRSATPTAAGGGVGGYTSAPLDDGAEQQQQQQQPRREPSVSTGSPAAGSGRSPRVGGGGAPRVASRSTQAQRAATPTPGGGVRIASGSAQSGRSGTAARPRPKVAATTVQTRKPWGARDPVPHRRITVSPPTTVRRPVQKEAKRARSTSVASHRAGGATVAVPPVIDGRSLSPDRDRDRILLNAGIAPLGMAVPPASLVEHSSPITHGGAGGRDEYGYVGGNTGYGAGPAPAPTHAAPQAHPMRGVVVHTPAEAAAAGVVTGPSPALSSYRRDMVPPPPPPAAAPELYPVEALPPHERAYAVVAAADPPTLQQQPVYAPPPPPPPMPPFVPPSVQPTLPPSLQQVQAAALAAAPPPPTAIDTTPAVAVAAAHTPLAALVVPEAYEAPRVPLGWPVPTSTPAPAPTLHNISTAPAQDGPRWSAWVPPPPPTLSESAAAAARAMSLASQAVPPAPAPAVAVAPSTTHAVDVPPPPPPPPVVPAAPDVPAAAPAASHRSASSPVRQHSLAGTASTAGAGAGAHASARRWYPNLVSPSL